MSEKSLIQRYREKVEQNPSNELARFSLGKALFDAENYEGALEQLNKALEQKPDWMMAQILVGKSEQALGHREAAVEAYRKARQLAVEQEHDGPREEMDHLLEELGG